MRAARFPEQRKAPGFARRRPRGAFFFGYFLLGKQKKVRPPPRRKAAHQKLRPRLRRGAKNRGVAGLEDDNARAYTAMYDISFVNEQGLAEHLSRLF